MSLLHEIRARMRELKKLHVRRVAYASNGAGEDVPIEAYYLMILQPQDHERARTSPGFIGRKDYRGVGRRSLVGEIGTIEDARIVLDAKHDGPPKLFGAGEYGAIVDEHT